MKVVLYARLSTRKQAEKDLSLPDQLRQLRLYCEHNGHQIIREYEEPGASGTDDNRLEFQRMMFDIENGEIEIDAILTLTTSRLFRNTQDAINYRVFFKTYGIRLISIHQDLRPDDNPSVELVETIFAAFDKHESQMFGRHFGRADDEYHLRYSESLVGEYGDSEVVIPDEEITIELPNPLCGNYRFKVQSEHGFTRKGLFESIKGVYEQHACSDAEFMALTAAGVSPSFGTKNSTYGILWRELCELYLSGVDYDPEKKLARVDVQKYYPYS